MALKSRLAVIAGGFGGLGLATGRRLHAQGARLALLYAPPEASRKKEVLQNFQNADAFECDITDPKSVKTAFDAIGDRSNAQSFPSIMVNAAGHVDLIPIMETTQDDMMKHYKINVMGPLLVSQAFARLYSDWNIEAGTPKKDAIPGRIVSIASQAAHIALDDHVAYCAAKAALIGMTKCMANEWGPLGITANTVSPGPVMTAMGKKAWADEHARAEYLKQIPTGRFAEPEEVADTIAFLCSDGAAMVNGEDIRIEGGFVIK